MLYSIEIDAHEIPSVNLTETFDIAKTAFDNIKNDYIKKGYKIIEARHDPIFTAYKDNVVLLVNLVKK